MEALPVSILLFKRWDFRENRAAEKAVIKKPVNITCAGHEELARIIFKPDFLMYYFSEKHIGNLHYRPKT